MRNLARIAESLVVTQWQLLPLPYETLEMVLFLSYMSNVSWLLTI